MPNPVINQNKINEFQQLLNNDNRAQIYLDLFSITGSQTFLNEAYISSFSEGTGAIANTANDLAKFFHSDAYIEEVDNFSRAISARLLTDMQTKLNSTGNGYLTDAEVLASAQAEWESRNLSEAFPGSPLLAYEQIANLQLGQASNSIWSLGTLYSGLSAVWNYTVSPLYRAATLDPTNALPIKPQDFKLSIEMGERYEVREREHAESGKEVFYVVDTENGDKTIHVFDTGGGNVWSLFGVQIGDIGVKEFINSKLWVDLSTSEVPIGSYIVLQYNIDDQGTISIVQKLQDPQTGHIYFKEAEHEVFENIEDAQITADVLNGIALEYEGSFPEHTITAPSLSVTGYAINQQGGYDKISVNANELKINQFVSTINVITQNGSVTVLVNNQLVTIVEGISYGRLTRKEYSLNGESILEERFIATDSNGNPLSGATEQVIKIHENAAGNLTGQSTEFTDKAGYKHTVVEKIAASNTNTLVHETITLHNGQIVSGNTIVVPSIQLLDTLQFIGGTAGSFLGGYLANGNVYKDIIYSAFFKSIGEHFGTFSAYAVQAGNTISDDLKAAAGQNVPGSILMNNPEFSKTFFTNLHNKFASALASVIVSKVGDELDMDSQLGGELFEAVGNEVTLQLISESLDIVFAGLDGALYDNLFDGNFNGIHLDPATILASFAAKKLAGEIIAPESEMAAIFGSVGSSVGVAIATGEILASTAIGRVFSSIGASWGPIGIAIGTFVGQVLGTALGNLFGDDSEPAAWAGIGYDYGANEYRIGLNVGVAGGDAQVAYNMAEQAVNGINSIINLTHGILRQGSRADLIDIGYEGDDFVVNVNGTAEKTFGTHADAIMYAAFKALKGFDLVGGHAIIMRAWHNSDATNLFEFKEDLQVAEAFQNYLTNPTGILALMMDEPDSTLAQSWAAVLQRAAELELHLPHADDFDGGWGEILLAQGVDPELIPNISGDSIVLTDPVTGAQTVLEHVIGPGYEIVRIPGTDGDDIIQVVVNGPSISYVDAGSGDDIINGSEQADIILGSGGDDTINGYGGNDWLHGGQGDDIIDGGTGEDLVIGGPDNDYLIGGSDSDKIYGNQGNDILQGLAGSDYLYGGFGDDTIYGDTEGATLDYAYGGDGNDSFYGNHSDVFIGGVGNDHSYLGGNGANIIQIGRGDGHDIIEGGAVTNYDRLSFDETIGVHELFFKQIGNDLKVLILGEDQSVTVKNYFTNGPQIKIYIRNQAYVADALAGDYRASITALVAADAALSEQPSGQYNTISNTTLAQRNAWGNYWRFVGNGDADLFFHGTNNSDPVLGVPSSIYKIMNGMAGNDTITSHNNDLYVHDYIYGDSGNDSIVSGGGDDTLVGGQGDDYLSGGTGIDQLFGGHGTDNLHGGDGRDRLVGGQGNDTLDGGVGEDELHGGDGNDQLTDTSGNNLFKGGLGDDTVSANGSGHQIIYGEDGNDTITSGSGNDKIFGGTGQDTITSGAGDDWINGEDGNDTIYGGSGADIIEGGLGTDTLNYSASTSAITLSLVTKTGTGGDAQGDLVTGIENVIGTSFNDTIEGSLGDNVLTAGSGTDILSYANIGAGIIANLSLTTAQNTIAAGMDTISGFENLTGSAFADTLIGDSNNNTLTGGDGDDIMEGGAGNDTLNGGGGDDTARYTSATLAVTVSLATTSAQNTGGAGTDTLSGMQNLIGSAYNDTLTGDSSGNIIEGGAGNDALNGGSGTDTVSYAGSTAAITVNLATATAQNTIGAGTDTLTSFENILGSSYNDTLTGDVNNNVIEGGAGNDVMDGAGGTDTASYKLAASGVTVSLAITSAQNTIGAGTDTLTNFERITGSAYNDTLTGNSSNNQLEGGAGNDVLDGGSGTDTLSYYYTLSAVTVSLSVTEAQNTIGAGIDTIINFESITGSAFNDVLIGSSGTNTLKGGDGNDILDGGAGNDTITGENGLDTVSYQSANTAVTINLSLATAQNTGGGGTDTITTTENITGSNYNDILIGDSNANILKGGLGHDVLNGGAGDDSLHGEDGNDTATYATAVSAITVNLATLTAQNTGGAGSDILSSIENLIGSVYNDTLTGDNNTNILEGGLGNDVLNGAGGIDTVSYNSASASITVNLTTTTAQNTVNAGSDTITNIENILGSAYNDTLTGDNNANVIEGGAGNDTLNGSGGNDTVSYKSAAAGITINLSTTTSQNTVGAGSDTISNFENIIGSAFNDTLTGTSGDNVIEAGAGDDTVQGGAGNDILDGGSGVDALTYAAAAAIVTVNLGLATVQNTGGAGNDTIFGFENLIGSGYSDTLTGDANANLIDGGNGNDIIDGGAGNDTLIGNAGTDTLTYATAGSGVVVSLVLTTAQDTIGAGLDTISGFERLTGSNFADTLIGDSAANILSGGDGDDILEGGLGDDTLNGGNGIDTARYNSATSAVTVSLATSSAQNTLGAGTDTLSSIQILIGSNFNDTLTGSSNDDTIEGGIGNDTLNGGSGNDTLSYSSATGAITVNLATTTAQNTGGAGTDTITAFENMIGSAFNDTLTGDGNSNVIDGGSGNDAMDGAAGTDTISYKSAISGVTVNLTTTTAQNTVGAGTDTILNFERIIGSAYNDILTGNSGTNQIEGGAGNDIMDGGSGTDTLAYQTALSAVTVNLALTTAQNTGGAGVDTISNFESITGSGFNDTLYGNSGSNTLKGGNGNDILCGAAGTDNLYGEAGTDIFLFEAATAFSGIDTVNDLTLAQDDKLNISSLLIGYNPLQSSIDNFVTFTTSGANTTFAVDRDGTGATYSSQTIATLNNITGLDADTLLANGNLIVV